jgi:hypothetical protein
VEEDSMTKTSYEDHICHEVKHDPSDKDHEIFKNYIKPFSFGTAEQWLKFMENLNVVIRDNGLNNNGLACLNLTCYSLKGEALCIFNDKAVELKEETRDSHVQYLHAITEHVFPKDNPLHKQKTFMCNHVFLLVSDKTISEFCARWIKLNNYLEFLPFRPNQCFTEDQTKNILYNIIPKCWQFYLQSDKFDINQCSVTDFLTNKDDSNKSTENSNDNKRKAKSKKNDSDALAPKRTCLIHGPESSHITDEC